MDYLAILREFGVPTAILLVVVAGLWRVIAWLGTNVAKPLVARAISFFDGLDKNVETLIDAASKGPPACDEAVKEIREHRAEWRATLPREQR